MSLISDSIAVALGIVLMLIVLNNMNPFVDNSPEYAEGYNAGFTEQNTTKYQAAVNITAVAFFDTGCTDEQYEYAKGYEHGYWQRCAQKQEVVKKVSMDSTLNESLRILDI